MAQMANCLSTMRETRVRSLGGEDLLEKEMATHSSILAWKIPWMEEPDRLRSMGVTKSWTQPSDFTSLNDGEGIVMPKSGLVNCDVSNKANVLFLKSHANFAIHSVKYLNVFKTSLVVKWLRLHAPNSGGLGTIPGQGTRSHVPQTQDATPSKIFILSQRYLFIYLLFP